MTTAVTFYIQRSILRTYNENLPVITLGEEIKNRTLKAELSLKKFLDGDKSINFEKDILILLKSSQALLLGAYDGTATELGKFEKPGNEENRIILKETIVDLENLISELQASGGAAIQSAAAANLMISLETFHEKADRLISHIRKNLNSDNSYLNILSWSGLSIVLISFSVLSFLIYKLQKGNDTWVAESELKLEDETRRVGTLSQFIESVSAGNYNIELHSGGAEDNLTATLVSMRDKLKQNAEDDRKRNWSTTGLAQIGEILRATSTTTSDLYDNIIKFVVKYTRSNQGGLFILNEETENHKFLELVACYAFERKKFLTKQVEIGAGLVGQCYLEGERVYLTEVPQEYISITSGLGGSNPNALLIVPLKVNDKIYGVLELASFNKYEEYEIDLVEKLAESIASTISTVRVNDTTRILLERTQQQTEEMKSQEEEIRQNMEELEATQEEMRRKQTILEKELEQSQHQSQVLRQQEKKLFESQDTLQAIVDNIPRAIFWKDKELRFMGCNKIFASIAGVASPEELIGKSDFDMAWSAQADAYRKDDMEVMRKRIGKLDIEEVNVNSEGGESWVLTSKVPIINKNNDVVAILGMFEDITKRKLKESEINLRLEKGDSALKELTALKHLIETGKV
jgi:PAS domain S-box-containing protein